MSVESSRLPRVLGGVLLASLVVAACGSDSQRRNVRDSEGGAPAVGGASGGAAGNGGVPDLVDENGGLPATDPGNAGAPPDVVAGAGGAPQGSAGAPRGEGGVAPQPEGGAAGAGGDFTAPDCSEIVIPDFELDQAVRALANKPTGVLTPADVVNVVDVRAFGVQTLEGIECLTNLASVDLSAGGAASSLTTLSQLKYLRKLTTLNLSDTDVASYEGIADVPGLRTVLLRSDTLPDFEAFADAPKLEELNLDGAIIGDLTALGDVKTLRKLSATYALLNDPESLAALTQITSLDLTATLRDATPLGGLTKLETLNLGENLNMTGMSALATLTNLKTLNVGRSLNPSISYVATLTKLVELDAISNDIVDISPLTGLTQLSVVNLLNNEITNLKPLADNSGIGTGDTVTLASNSGINCTAQAANIKAMRDRGATVDICP